MHDAEVGLVDVDPSGEDDSILYIGKGEGELGDPVSRCGVAVSVASRDRKKALVGEKLQTEVYPLLNRYPVVAEEGSRNGGERLPAIPALVPLHTVGCMAVGLDPLSSAASAAAYGDGVEHLGLK